MRGFDKKKARAFTLVELLVTIMILMILAGLILPAIKGARERSRDVLCKNNLKQLQVAAMSYAINGDGSLPYAISTEHYINTRRPQRWTQYRTGWIDWVNYVAHDDGHYTRVEPGETPWWGPRGLTCITNGALWPFVKSTKAYACPEWQRSGVGPKNDPDGGLITYNSTNNPAWRNYAMNSQLHGVNIGNIEASKRLLFAELGITNFLADGTTRIATRNMTEKLSGYTWVVNDRRTEADAWNGTFKCTPDGTTNPWPLENVGLYHSGKANVVFVDGHLEKVDWNQTTNACSGNW